MNSLFKPYLPVDDEGFVTVDSMDDILNKEISHGSLLRCLKKTEERATTSGVEQSGEVITLTDDELEPDHEEDSLSNHALSSGTSSHHDDISSDFDWYSATLSFGAQSMNCQNVIETVSIDSPPSMRKSPSASSLDSEDWKMDTAANSAPLEFKYDSEEHDQQESLDVDQPQQSTSTDSTVQENTDVKLNGDTNQNSSKSEPMTYESLFSHLVKDINSTHLSFPSNGNMSSDTEIKENGDRSQNNENTCSTNDSTFVQKMEIDEIDENSSNTITDQVPVDCDDVNSTTKNKLIQQSEFEPINNGESNESESIVMNEEEIPNHTEMPADEMNNEHCDNEVNNILKSHEETLKNIEEIVADDLKKRQSVPVDSDQIADDNQNNTIAQTPIPPPKPILVDTACSPLIFEAEESQEPNELIEPIEVSEIDESESQGTEQTETENAETDKVESEKVEFEKPEAEVSEAGNRETENPAAEVVLDENRDSEIAEPEKAESENEKIESPLVTVVEIQEPVPAVDKNEVSDINEALKADATSVPVVEATISAIDDTSLLTKSTQEILFKDDVAVELFTDLFSNGPSYEENTVTQDSDTSSIVSSDSPITFLVNGLDPNFILKTYSRKNRRPVIETKTISTQTISTQTSPVQSPTPSPVTILDDRQKINKETLNDKEEDEQFLSDIFNTTGNTSRSALKVISPETYLSSTPKPLKKDAIRRGNNKTKPIAERKTKKSANKVKTEKIVEAVVSVQSAMIPPTITTNPMVVQEIPPIVVKRKRGRPRKYPLPESLETVSQPTYGLPAVEKPIKERKPRGRKPKPKEIPPPPPPIERPRRCRTRRMTILQEGFKIQSTLRRPTRTSRMSKAFTLIPDTPKMATILGRRDYNKCIDTSKSMTSIRDNTSAADSSKVLYSFSYRLNGRQNEKEMTKSNNDSQPQTSDMTSTYESTQLTPSLDATQQLPQPEPITTSESSQAVTQSQLTSPAEFKAPVIPILPPPIFAMPTPPLRLPPRIQSTLPTESTISTQSSILARKTYFKPKSIKSYRRSSIYSRKSSIFNRTSMILSKTAPPLSQSSSFKSRISSSKMSPPFVLPVQQKSSPARVRQVNRVQSYSKIDLITCRSPRQRKKELNIPMPQVVVKRIDTSALKNLNVSEISKSMTTDNTANSLGAGSYDVQNSTPIEIDLTNDSEIQLTSFSPSINSTQEMSDYDLYLAKKQRHLTSKELETDMTYEFTTDPESNLDDTDDSTRKSKRSRKRPKILDL